MKKAKKELEDIFTSSTDSSAKDNGKGLWNFDESKKED
jgi:hypothetical protein